MTLTKIKQRRLPISKRSIRKHLPEQYNPPEDLEDYPEEFQALKKPKHRLFVMEFIKDFNAMRACRASYPNLSNATTYKARSFALVKRQDVKRAILAMQRELLWHRNISRNRILDEALDVYYCCREDADYSTALKALELVAKMCGFIQTRHLMEGQIELQSQQKPLVITHNDLPLESRKKLLQLIREQQGKEEDTVIEGGKLE